MEGSQEEGGAAAMGGKVVDFHTHLVPRSWPTFARRYGYGGFVHIDHDQEQVSVPGNARLLRDSEVIAEITPNSWDMALRVQDMDRAGVDLQVVSIVPELFAYWAKADDAADSARILNNGIAEQVKEFPDRFVALGTLPMQAPELAVAEMERCVVELGFVGVVIGTHVNQWQLDAPELITFWEMAEQLGCCVFVHPNVGEARIEEGVHALPQLVGVSAEMCHAATCMLTSGLLDSFPTLKVCFAHGAGTFPYVRGQLEHGMATGSHCNLKHMVETLEPGQYRGRLFCDSIVHSPEATKFLVDAMSSDAVVFGSDYPYPLGQGSKAAGAGAQGYNVSPSVHLPTLDENTVKQVMGTNALQLLFGGNAEGAKKN